MAFMQNQWLENAAYHNRRDREVHATDRELWHRLRARKVAFALFRGCKSGRVLQQALGLTLCERIVWEESHWEATPTAAGAPGIDLEHIRDRIAYEGPDVIVCFGKVAQEALRELRREIEAPVMHADHPAGRNNAKVLASLAALRGELEAWRPIAV